jgi:hypothetical protein
MLDFFGVKGEEASFGKRWQEFASFSYRLM